jgi:hypothetical protein
MIHPHTELRFVNQAIGYGVFATAPIQKGTIVYVKDQLEIEITQRQFDQMDQAYQDVVEKYSYIDQRGVRIVSWDHGKYVNHSCECNSMSTGYGFEVAIRDISPNEEITDEYGLFNIPYPIKLSCNCTRCRKVLLPTDIDTYFEIWDARVLEAIRHVPEVAQPLWGFIDKEARTELMSFLSGHSEYRSVINLKYLWPPAEKRAEKRR